MRDGHLGAHELDELRLEGMDAARAAAARRHLEGCAACRELEASLAADREHFARVVLPRTRGSVVERAVGAVPARAARPAWRWLPLVALPAAAALLLVLRPGQPGPGEGGEAGDEVRTKGGPILMVHARRGDEVFAVGPGRALKEGDAIRFSVVPEGHQHVLVIGADSAGEVTVYVPYGGSESRPLPAAPGRIDLPEAIGLDATPGPERIYAFFARAPIPAAPLMNALEALTGKGPEAIRAASRLELPALPVSVAQTSVLLEKGP